MPGPYSAEVTRRPRAPRRARVSDVREIALSMPGAKVVDGGQGVYQVAGRSFIFFRSRRPDAFDPETGERYDDVIVFWVADEGAKREILAEEGTPFFTTPHFDGHPSVLLRGSRIGELDRDQLAETVYDAWLARASKTAARKWLAERGLT